MSEDTNTFVVRACGFLGVTYFLYRGSRLGFDAPTRGALRIGKLKHYSAYTRKGYITSRLSLLDPVDDRPIWFMYWTQETVLPSDVSDEMIFVPQGAVPAEMNTLLTFREGDLIYAGKPLIMPPTVSRDIKYQRRMYWIEQDMKEDAIRNAI